MLTATTTTEGTDVRWIKTRAGQHETSDGLWRARCIVAEPRSRRLWVLEAHEGDGWQVVEPCRSLREAQLWVAQQAALDEATQRELWIDEATIESGNGTIVRLRLMRGDDVVREVIVRDRVVLPAGDTQTLAPAEARALATVLMQAADLTGEDD